uniref:Hexosyltransferase n=1 Tax=Panagrolaimus sp. ES5 TaxID=591445 RepID=A0AC34FY09_9BILA
MFYQINKLRCHNVYALILMKAILLLCGSCSGTNTPQNDSFYAKNEKKTENFKIQFQNLSIDYFFQVDNKLHCDDMAKLLIIIPTRPSAFKTRMAIRNSWLKNTSSSVTHRFFIGSTSDESVQKLNQKEFQNFNDLIISNLHDSYKNISLKTFAMFQWQQLYCPKVQYVHKADDDTVIDIPRLQYWIKKNFKQISQFYYEKVIFGKIWVNIRPSRDPQNKWYVSEKQWKENVFPDYCSGPNYLLTSKSVNLLIDEARNHVLNSVEDLLFTGIIAESAGIQRIDKSKIFGVGSEFSSYPECGKDMVPYLSTIYFDTNVPIEDGPNKFDEYSKKLNNLQCLRVSHVLVVCGLVIIILLLFATVICLIYTTF